MPDWLLFPIWLAMIVVTVAVSEAGERAIRGHGPRVDHLGPRCANCGYLISWAAFRQMVARFPCARCRRDFETGEER